MSSRAIVQVFQTYQKARASFVHAVAELALKPSNAAGLEEGNVLALLEPLLADVCPNVRQCAGVALGRLIELRPTTAATWPTLAALLPRLVDELVGTRHKHVKQSALLVLRALAKTEARAALAIVQADGLKALVAAAADVEPAVKEGSLCTLAHVARHGGELAQAVADAGTVPNALHCLLEVDVRVKRAAAGVLADVARHSIALAQHVVDCGAVPQLARAVGQPDAALKRVALYTLSSIARYTPDMAEAVVEANTFPAALVHLAHACPRVRRAAAALVRDVVRHTQPLAQMVAHLGGLGALLECAAGSINEVRLPCYVALGYMAGHSDQLAMALIEGGGVDALGATISVDVPDIDESLAAVAVWALGQVGKHSAEHARAIAAAGLLAKMLTIHNDRRVGVDLQEKTRNTLKLVLQKCMLVDALEPLIEDAPPAMLKYVLGQFTRILPNDPKARRKFVMSGALKRMQQIDAEPGSTLYEYVTVINSCFPDEIVRYYSPGYSEQLLDLVEQYAPDAMSNILREARMTASEAQTADAFTLEDAVSVSTSQELMNRIF